MSVSLEVRRYLGHNWLVFREWDGVDKPQYSSVFKITEEELDFEGGRFERMQHTTLFKQKLSVGIIAETKIEEIINWIHENTTGLWYFNISTSIDDTFIDNEHYAAAWIFYFKETNDATGFKLRWS